MASFDIDTTIQNVKTMLAAISGWQTLCGVADSTAAAKRIYEYGVEEPEDGRTLCPCIVLDLDQESLRREGGKIQGHVIITVRIELEIPEANRSSYSAEGRWFWQSLQPLLAGIDTNQGTSGGLMLNSVAMLMKPGRLDDDTNNGRCEWMTMLGLEVYLI